MRVFWILAVILLAVVTAFTMFAIRGRLPTRPLKTAVGFGDREQVQRHVAWGVSLDFHSACRVGLLEEVRRMLSEDPTLIDRLDDNGYTPLLLASRYGCRDVAELLITNGSNVNDQCLGAGNNRRRSFSRASIGEMPWPGARALHMATLRDSEPLIELFLRQGAQIDGRDECQSTALHYAAGQGRVTAATVLIRHGADIASRDWRGRTPLHYAASLGNPPNREVARLLIEAGADVNAGDRNGRTPLYLAVTRNDGDTQLVPSEMASLLVTAGASVKARDEGGATPLHSAAFGDYAVMVDFLADRGADLDAENNRRETPLRVAVKYDRQNAVRALLAKGATLDIQSACGLGMSAEVTRALDEDPRRLGESDCDDNTLLHMAALGNHADTVELLLSRGAAVDAANSSGYTALHTAAYCGNDAAVEALLAHRADTTLRTTGGETALDLATQRGHASTVRLLEAGGRAD